MEGLCTKEKTRLNLNLKAPFIQILFMRPFIEFKFPAGSKEKIKRQYRWPANCDHIIPYAIPLYEVYEKGSLLNQTIDGGDYRIEFRTLTLEKNDSLEIEIRKPCISIIISIKGQLTGVLPDTIAIELTAKTYCLLYLPKGKHQLNATAGQTRWICISPPLHYLKNMAQEDNSLKKIMNRLRLKAGEGLEPTRFSIPMNLHRIIHQFQKANKKGAALDFELRQTIIKILGIYNEQVKKLQQNKMHYPTIEETAIAAKEYILSDLGNVNLGGLNEIARHFYVTTETLTTAFKKLTGKTIPAFIGDERMEWAKRLLEKKEMHVFEIAWMVGYTDTANFNRKYKKKFGHAPLNRKQGKG